MLKFSHKSTKYCEINSPPLSENICLGGRIYISTFEEIIFEDLVWIIAALLKWINSSITWKYHKPLPNWFKFIATVWLKSLTVLKPTNGRWEGFYILYRFYKYYKLYQAMVKHHCLINFLVLIKASCYLTMHDQTADEFSFMLLFFPNCFYSFQKPTLSISRKLKTSVSDISIA